LELSTIPFQKLVRICVINNRTAIKKEVFIRCYRVSELLPEPITGNDVPRTDPTNASPRRANISSNSTSVGELGSCPSVPDESHARNLRVVVNGASVLGRVGVGGCSDGGEIVSFPAKLNVRPEKTRNASQQSSQCRSVQRELCTVP
jgi:hypothetical protein